MDWLQAALIGDLVSLEQQMDGPSEEGPGRTRGSVTTLAMRSFIIVSLLKLTNANRLSENGSRVVKMKVCGHTLTSEKYPKTELDLMFLYMIQN